MHTLSKYLFDIYMHACMHACIHYPTTSLIYTCMHTLSKYLFDTYIHAYTIQVPLYSPRISYAHAGVSKKNSVKKNTKKY